IWDHTSGTYYRSAVHIGVGGQVILQMPSAPPINQWVHFAVTWDGSNLIMYIDGVVFASLVATNNWPTLSENANVFILSSKGPQYYINGSVANVGVWSSCITSNDVLSLYTGIDQTTVEAGTQIFYDPLMTGVTTPVGPTLTN